MQTISRMKPEQVGEVKRLICTVVQEIFGNSPATPKAVRRLMENYERLGVLADIDDPQSTYFDDRGEFLVLMDDNSVVGAGAIKRLDQTTCELKRMWFLPQYRGKGWGRKMAETLLGFARKA